MTLRDLFGPKLTTLVAFIKGVCHAWFSTIRKFLRDVVGIKVCRGYLVEQAIRFVVIDRRITQGTRREAGRRWCERIWTTIATCAQQGRSAFEFILDSVHAHFGGGSPPSLLPSGP